jgi:signal transduction histidine kinase
LIHTALQSSLQEIRNLASGLRLPELSELDLAGVIHKAVEDFTQKTGRVVDIQGPSRLACGAALKSAAYRLVQEALNNGHQHGDPTQQWVRYGMVDGLFRVEIEDDGRGFDPAHAQSQGRRRQLGLAGLEERVEILGGTFTVESAPGRGTLVRARLPLDTPASKGGEEGFTT